MSSRLTVPEAAVNATVRALRDPKPRVGLGQSPEAAIARAALVAGAPALLAANRRCSCLSGQGVAARAVRALARVGLALSGAGFVFVVVALYLAAWAHANWARWLATALITAMVSSATCVLSMFGLPDKGDVA